MMKLLFKHAIGLVPFTLLISAANSLQVDSIRNLSVEDHPVYNATVFDLPIRNHSIVDLSCNTTADQSLCDVAVGQTTDSNSVVYRENTVHIAFQPPGGYHFAAGEYVIFELSIPPDQAKPGAVGVGSQREWYDRYGQMEFEIGRKATKGVAEWWKQRIAFKQNTFNKNPKDLNFAFIGQLELRFSGGVLGEHEDTYVLGGVAFGQGRSGLRNNWWFGGRSAIYTADDDYTVRILGRGRSGFGVYFYFNRGKNPVDVVQLTRIEYPPYTVWTLQPPFKRENLADTWQTRSGAIGMVPPYIIYYNQYDRKALQLQVLNGRIIDSNSHYFDTAYADLNVAGNSVALFVMDPQGNIYATRQHKQYLLHHSSLVAGGPVASAGELRAVDGYITYINTESGHYLPDHLLAQTQFKETLVRLGYTNFPLDTAESPVPETGDWGNYTLRVGNDSSLPVESLRNSSMGDAEDSGNTTRLPEYLYGDNSPQVIEVGGNVTTL